MPKFIGTQKRADICAACKNIPVELFYGEYLKHEEDPRYTLYDSYETFLQSSKTCAACQIWFQYLNLSRVCYEDGPVQLLFRSEPQVFSPGSSEGNISCVVRPGTAGEKQWGQATVLEELPSGPQGIQSLRELIDDCVENHTGAGCQAGASQSVHPTRLLCVRDACGRNILRIVPGRDAAGRWLTLSHCWGTVAPNAPWKLLQSRLQGFSTSIDPADLPRTFLDAIDICRKLGESYIWIDSLCIIQDSSEDWTREASNMANIYASSLCTLSSATASAEGGCIRPRPMEFMTPLEFEIVSPTDKHTSITIILYSPLPEEYHLEEECLVNTRAWCYQEKELSRRFVQYTRNFFIWQCGERKVSEARLVEYVDQGTGTLSLNPGHEYVYSKSLEPADSISPDLKSHFNQWYEYIQEYSRRDLTSPGDRLAAIEGLARRHKRALAADTRYVGGLWEQDLRRGLLWQILDPKPRAGRKQDFPSWSWAAPNAFVDYNDLLDISSDENYIKSPLEPVISVPVTEEDSSQPGRLPAMCVSGRLVEAKPTFHPSNVVGEDDHRGLQFCDQRISLPVGLRPVLDWADETWDVSERLHCLILMMNQVKDFELKLLFPCGWILRRLNEQESKYERIGLFMSGLYLPEDDTISVWPQFLDEYEKCRILEFTIE
jgi:hypothetical protein